jgi:hypothetical protein
MFMMGRGEYLAFNTLGWFVISPSWLGLFWIENDGGGTCPLAQALASLFAWLIKVGWGVRFANTRRS